MPSARLPILGQSHDFRTSAALPDELNDRVAFDVAVRDSLRTAWRMLFGAEELPGELLEDAAGLVGGVGAYGTYIFDPEPREALAIVLSERGDYAKAERLDASMRAVPDIIETRGHAYPREEGKKRILRRWRREDKHHPDHPHRRSSPRPRGRRERTAHAGRSPPDDDEDSEPPPELDDRQVPE